MKQLDKHLFLTGYSRVLANNGKRGVALYIIASKYQHASYLAKQKCLFSLFNDFITAMKLVL